MGLFDKIKSGRVSGDGVYMTPGTHMLRVKEMKEFEGYGGEVFVVEFEVVESNCDEEAFAEQRRQKEAGAGPYSNSNIYSRHKPGDVVSFVQKFSGKNADVAASVVKTFVNSLVRPFGTADDLGPDEWAQFVGPNQMARGAIMKCQGMDKATRDGSKMVTRYRWELMEPSEAMSSAAG